MRNIYIDEQLIGERVNERQRDIERRHLLKRLPRQPHHGLLSRLLNRLGAGFVVYRRHREKMQRFCVLFHNMRAR